MVPAEQATKHVRTAMTTRRRGGRGERAQLAATIRWLQELRSPKGGRIAR
jgi:hypothetical protein